jgi:hypothetical protein
VKPNKTMTVQEVLNHRRRKDKQSESSIDLATNTQNLKEQQ